MTVPLPLPGPAHLQHQESILVTFRTGAYLFWFLKFSRIAERGGSPADLRCYLREFADLLVRHIRFEARIVFPALEKALPKEQLEAVGRDLSAFHAQTRTDTCPAQPGREVPSRQ